MADLFIPKMNLVPKGATEEERRRMFDEYNKRLIKFNPGFVYSDGTRKSFFGWIKGLFS